MTKVTITQKNAALSQLRKDIFQGANKEKAILLEKQTNCMQYLIARNQIQVPANGVTTSLSIVIGNDADFELKKLLASYTIPTNVLSPYANRPSIQIRITDKASGKLLTDGFVDLNLIATPGYFGNTLFFPYKFSHFFRRSQTVLIELQNLDTNNGAYTAPAQSVSLCLDGLKWFTA